MAALLTSVLCSLFGFVNFWREAVGLNPDQIVINASARTLWSRPSFFSKQSSHIFYSWYEAGAFQYTRAHTRVRTTNQDGERWGALLNTFIFYLPTYTYLLYVQYLLSNKKRTSNTVNRNLECFVFGKREKLKISDHNNIIIINTVTTATHWPNICIWRIAMWWRIGEVNVEPTEHSAICNWIFLKQLIFF